MPKYLTVDQAKAIRAVAVGYSSLKQKTRIDLFLDRPEKRCDLKKGDVHVLLIVYYNGMVQIFVDRFDMYDGDTWREDHFSVDAFAKAYGLDKYNHVCYT
jgi:hypothetical protein